MLGQERDKWNKESLKDVATTDPEISYRQFNHHILSKNENVDTFLHIRNPDYESKLLDLYKPKKYLSEPYKEFDTREFCKGNQPLEHQIKQSVAMWSRFYSIFKVIEQKKQHEEENNFKYDCVFISRYDLLAFEDYIFSDYNMSYFHVPFSLWHMTRKLGFVGESFPDLWFFSNSEQMDEFSTLFLKAEEHSKDLKGNCISPHWAVSQKLRSMEAKVRFVLNADVHDCNDITRCALARMRTARFWNYDEKTKLYSLKNEFKEKLNRESYDIDWSRNYQQHWSMYKGMTADEFSASLPPATKF